MFFSLVGVRIYVYSVFGLPNIWLMFTLNMDYRCIRGIRVSMYVSLSMSVLYVCVCLYICMDLYMYIRISVCMDFYSTTIKFFLF